MFNWKELYNHAILVAIKWHGEQKDKSGILYITHPLRLAEQLDRWEDKIVAALHDVIEDTDCTMATLKLLFPPIITDAVDAITRRDGESETDYYVRVMANPIATRVKYKDLKDNMRLERFHNPLKQKDIDRAMKYHKNLRMLHAVLYRNTA